jgi:hypothetical protein
MTFGDYMEAQLHHARTGAAIWYPTSGRVQVRDACTYQARSWPIAVQVAKNHGAQYIVDLLGRWKVRFDGGES